MFPPCFYTIPTIFCKCSEVWYFFFSVKYYKNDGIFIHVLVYLNFSHGDNVGNDLSNCSSNMWICNIYLVFNDNLFYWYVEYSPIAPCIFLLPTLPEHMSSSPHFSGVRVTRSLVLYMFCSSFIFLYFLFWPLCCLFFFDIRFLIASLWYLQTLLTESIWNAVCYWLIYEYIYIQCIDKLIDRTHSSINVKRTRIPQLKGLFDLFFVLFCMQIKTHVVCRRARVLFTLFVLVWLWLCPTHIVLCFLFCLASLVLCVPYVANFFGLSIRYCPFCFL